MSYLHNRLTAWSRVQDHQIRKMGEETKEVVRLLEEWIESLKTGAIVEVEKLTTMV